MKHFKDLALCEPLLKAIAQEGYDTPTPIQAKAIGPALEGRDILGCAQTGTGKTAAFALPILHLLHTAKVDKKRRGPVLPRALILSPTRELAGQIEESFGTYGRHTPLRQTVIYGGVSQFHQVRKLRNGVDILVATPGRLMDLMEQRLVDLRSVEIFVLDEADRMLDMGFIQPIRRISEALKEDRQTLLFSATMPKNIKHLANALLTDPVKVTVTPVASAAPLIDQFVYQVSRQGKGALLEHLLNKHRSDCTLVFTRTKHGADKVTRNLNRAGITAIAIHGNKAQNQRQRALDSFRSGRSKVLVATDVAARGLDVDGITHVFNYDLPNEPEAYIHRIGRTGRAGASGDAISFCDRDERNYLRAIEKLTGKRLTLMTAPSELKLAPRPSGQHPVGEAASDKPQRGRPSRSDQKERTPRGRKPRPGGPAKSGTSKPKRKSNAKRTAAGGGDGDGGGSYSTAPGKGPKRKPRTDAARANNSNAAKQRIKGTSRRGRRGTG